MRMDGSRLESGSRCRAKDPQKDYIALTAIQQDDLVCSD
jgi:hypothetical protein